MANGRVVTGFSKPYIADYTHSAGVVTYSNPAPLARGVEVTLSPESTDDNNFYADNVQAESANGIFTGGTVTLTVDGLFTAMKRRVLGYPAAGEDGWTAVGAGAQPPYVGLGYIVRYMSDGVTSYVPTVLAKVKFNIPEESAATQEDEIDWQTSELEANLMRDNTSEQNWKFEGAAYTTEADAEAALLAKLGYVPDATLSALSIGSLTLTPTFSKDTTSYAASTTNDTDTISATATDSAATIVIKNGTTTVVNGEAASWSAGENTVTVTVTNGTQTKTYTVTVTKGD